MKNWIELMIAILVIVLIFALGTWWEVYKWHVFQEAYQSHIGFWKWLFFVDHHH